MKMRIEMKKNPDPISTIEIKRENQNTKFLDFLFVGWKRRERKVRQRKRKRKERKVGLRKKKKNCRERERLEGMMVMMEVPGVLITNGNNNSYSFTTSLIKLFHFNVCSVFVFYLFPFFSLL